jgi:hypothetical protein
MTHVLEIEANAQQAIRQLDFCEGELLNSTIGAELGFRKAELVRTAADLGALYPVLNAIAKQYWRDEDEPTEDDGHDSLDLAIIRVLLSGLMLGEATHLRRFNLALDMFQNALADLKTWCPGWNFSQGAWD